MDDKKIGGDVDKDPGSEPAPGAVSASTEVLFNFRLPKWLRDECKAAAARDGRTMSSTVRLLIEDYLKGGRHG